MNLDEKFTDLADHISEFVGKWWFTTFSLIALTIWAIYGAAIVSQHVADWFTSNQWNFPLNTVTTVGEWFLEGLVLAAANRAERRNRELHELLLRLVRHEEQEVVAIEEKLGIVSRPLDGNTEVS